LLLLLLLILLTPEHLSEADVLSLAPPETGAQELLDIILHCNVSLGARPDSAWTPARQRNLPKARRVDLFLSRCLRGL
jgi:hypothetical protein